METPKTIQFIAERLKGGAYAALADIVMRKTVEPPVHASITYYPEQSGEPQA